MNSLFAVATRIFVIVEISGAASSWSDRSSRYDHHKIIVLRSSHQSSPLIAGYLELGLSQDRKPSGAGSQKNEAHIPPLLGVAPLGIVPLSKEHQFQYRWVSIIIVLKYFVLSWMDLMKNVLQHVGSSLSPSATPE